MIDSLTDILPLPTLSPSALWPLPRARHFPLGEPRLETTYLGRNAVWASVKALRLAGAEIIVPAYHHGVEIAALVAAGAAVRFARIDASLRLDVEHIESQINDKTRALYVIHYLGFPQPMADILSLARRHGLKVIEDCALALFSCDGLKPLGSFGDASIFCFYKTLPVPHGGALWLRNQTPDVSFNLAPPLLSTLSLLTGSMLLHSEQALPKAGGFLRQTLRHATVKTRKRAHNLHVPVGTQVFDERALGLRMSSLSEFIVRSTRVDELVVRRRRNYGYLLEALGPQRTLWPTLPPGVCPLFFPLRVQDKDAALKTLHQNGMGAIDFWRFGHSLCDSRPFPLEAKLRQQVIELPCHQDLTEPQLFRMAEVAKGL